MTTPAGASAAEKAQEELDYIVEEYQFMRSFGMNHARAADAIGHHPDVLRRRLERNGLIHLM